ncbi:hypothetical protein tb265_16800 [Gemmatimonadetes bacterium T265]|nr:hypothetical protein tb265_16800 [Gemmatimonadetes bacterium T265]
MRPDRRPDRHMAHNQKLTPLLAGRVVAAVEPPSPAAPAPASRFAPSPAATWHVRFGDGSTLAVRTDGTAPTGADRAIGAAVSDVTQKGTTFTLVLGAPAAGSLLFHTAEAAACVMLRDAKGQMEYAD